MKLSVIIVNYNVSFFLQQCLLAVFKSKNIDFEVFVVDNNSTDNSCEMIKQKFPQVHLIENKINQGFAKANNQALLLSKAEYVLLLNPDTVVGEQTFEKVCSFMDENQSAGGLGVKMINGSGVFLPESKRGFPSPFVSFCKIFGLSTFFPTSRIFGKYHLRYLNENQTHKIDILSGAFMLIRNKTLEKIGLLDETFFMYGEDIDMSYRITLAGYENYYLPEKIIHYKGESTQKDSLKYVKIFYESMIIFFKKHYKKASFLFSASIQFAIFLRAMLSAGKRLLSYILPTKKEKERRTLLFGNQDDTELVNQLKPTLVLPENEDATTTKIKKEIKAKKINFIVLSTKYFSFEQIIDISEKLSIKNGEIGIYHHDEKCIVSSKQTILI